jgi:hypothetical protein
MDAADFASAGGPAEADQAGATPIAITWAMTSVEPGKRERIGKIWSPNDKWGVTEGAKRQAYFFERKSYIDLKAFAVDLSARLRDGGFALVAGSLRAGLEPLRVHRRAAENFVDEPCWVFALDFDGLTPAEPGERIDRPGDFGEAALDEAFKRLPAAFDADCLLYATSSTGLTTNAKGERADGRAWFRLVFLLSRPLTFAEQKQIVLALVLGRRRRRGLSCLDTSIYNLPQFSFVTRPKFPAGMADPIQKPTFLCTGTGRCVDVDALLSEIGVSLASEQRGKTRQMREGWGADERLLHVDPAVRGGLIELLVRAIPNDIEEREKWIGVAHAIKGSVGNDWGEDLWLEFCARWTKGDDDPDEDLRVWESIRLEDGRAGIGALLRLAQQAGTPEALEALAVVRGAQAAAAFADDLPPEDPDEESEPAETARNPWARFRAGLQWSGADRAQNSSSRIAWLEPGVAMFGSKSQEGVARDRAWITNRHARSCVTTTNGMPVTGKSLLSVAVAHAIAAERPDIAGLNRIERPGAVVIIAADGEGAEEFQRKEAASRKYYGLSNADFKHPIFVFEEPGPFVKKTNNGDWTPSEWIIEQAPKLALMREDDKLALIVVDTLLGVSGGGSTSETTDMQAIVNVAKMLATVLDCSVEIINHLTKGGAKADPTSMDAGLGARPLTATSRFVSNLIKAGDVVTVSIAKKSYAGGPQGSSYFEFRSVEVPIEIYDVDNRYVGIEPRSLGVLVPADLLTLKKKEDDEALEALWDAHNKGVEIRLGGSRGPLGPEHGNLIIQQALGLTLDKKGRVRADAIIARLVANKRVDIINAQRGRGKPRKQLVPIELLDDDI